MIRKYYILALTFLCLLCGQLSYGFDAGEGNEDDWLLDVFKGLFDVNIIHYELDENGQLISYDFIDSFYVGKNVNDDTTGIFGPYVSTTHFMGAEESGFDWDDFDEDGNYINVGNPDDTTPDFDFDSFNPCDQSSSAFDPNVCDPYAPIPADNSEDYLSTIDLIDTDTDPEFIIVGNNVTIKSEDGTYKKPSNLNIKSLFDQKAINRYAASLARELGVRTKKFTYLLQKIVNDHLKIRHLLDFQLQFVERAKPI